MEISNKILIAITIGIVILLFYVNSIRNDVSRYKNIIDTYMSEHLTEKKKPIIKKVRFNEPTDKKK